ncbi:uncharacterized protein MELLADRAFT_107435 [Melampsora larici-populina 98AG31]|uniref:J domain-containing protein n=1 Tax=Melampsora larici-populina (strain 98AG31 / pathotype 3-4-7) TaxID=747676 RepID=F4RPS9_MELLP|nr:uncharacterized protein MELLADRAFT_107435 [Melampsora larici-populina 98AG31]EGG05686.1 hypothetical protein MELLADRAFT_107435 [Melampsora larici-populina 98AG31]
MPPTIKSHRAPPDPTLQHQQRVDQLMDQAEFANLKGSYTDSAKIYLQLLDFYSTKMARCESQNGTIGRGPHTGWILSCFNLTRCYLRLQQPQAAFDTLQQAWNPDSSLIIPATHPKYLELSHLYFEVEASLNDGTEDRKYRLALAPTANPAQIKSRWRSCMLYFHPDKGGHTGVAQQIAAAAEVLLDPESRRQYDAKVHAMSFER